MGDSAKYNYQVARGESAAYKTDDSFNSGVQNTRINCEKSGGRLVSQVICKGWRDEWSGFNVVYRNNCDAVCEVPTNRP